MAQIEFNENEIRTMQDDAIRRVLEMQRRSNQKLRQSNMTPPQAQAMGMPTPQDTPPTDIVEEPQATPTVEQQRSQPIYNENTNSTGQNNSSNSRQNTNNNSPLHNILSQTGLDGIFSNMGKYVTPTETGPSTRDSGSALNLIPDSVFAQFNLDKERAILLLLVFLLIKEKASMPLILALCYLII